MLPFSPETQKEIVMRWNKHAPNQGANRCTQTQNESRQRISHPIPHGLRLAYNQDDEQRADMRMIMRGAAAALFYLSLIVFPLIVGSIYDPMTVARPFSLELAVAFGYVGLAIMAFQFC